MPVRAAEVMRDAAARSLGRSKEGKREAESITKPSRSRAERAAVYGSVVDVVMLGIVSKDGGWYMVEKGA